ncbi:Aste57867_13016 [Aphanomyces stellatus]|uniref:Aste57867_13016 protein n=1 Tax=Aphanomyces stellatus TaxID=120398 RepID=A0A485KI20_9STRA|nr:hypothetical protein As57867_012968 [Aphanomyces stellatus]KAF0704809.1 hypothetical protein As57867_007228 [Aphanomyces stellatus]VFT84176.1 Aste57867_7253 [Aphanomyces stellatus]VFT89861.1 Aste57867_13016 [Aphanomyces stellatus]
MQQPSKSPVESSTALPPVACPRRFPSMCVIPGCLNQVYAHNRCTKHGGRPRCQIDGCNSNARRFGVCWRHDIFKGPRAKCKWLGCDKAAHKNHLCARHGGAQYCLVQHCTSYARSRGVCKRHLVQPETSFGVDPIALEKGKVTLDVEDIHVLSYFLDVPLDVARVAEMC